MRALLLRTQREPLALGEVPRPRPDPGEVLVRVRACAVCRTDLHIADGELTHPKLPLVRGHQIVGVVEGIGTAAGHLAVGARVGVPWLGWTDGTSRLRRTGRANLCERS